MGRKVIKKETFEGISCPGPDLVYPDMSLRVLGQVNVVQPADGIISGYVNAKDKICIERCTNLLRNGSVRQEIPANGCVSSYQLHLDIKSRCVKLCPFAKNK